MANVSSGFWGIVVLGPHAHTTWVAPINAGFVWHFSVDNTTIGYTPSDVGVTAVITRRTGNVHQIRVRVSNWGSVSVGFALRWSVVD